MSKFSDNWSVWSKGDKLSFFLCVIFVSSFCAFLIYESYFTENWADIFRLVLSNQVLGLKNYIALIFIAVGAFVTLTRFGNSLIDFLYPDSKDRRLVKDKIRVVSRNSSHRLTNLWSNKLWAEYRLKVANERLKSWGDNQK